LFILLYPEIWSFGSGEFLVSGYTIKSTGTMTEGTKNLSPFTNPVLSDDDVVPVSGGITEGREHKAAGVKPNECLAMVLSISYGNRCIQL
jgi:hypothetical protein